MTSPHGFTKRLFGWKGEAVLRIAALSPPTSEWQLAYNDACERFSEKAVIRKFEELIDRGYIECGVSSRTGWLTEKGRAALRQL